MAIIDPTTGRPAWSGPQGQPGSSMPSGAATTPWVMPDGRTVYYDPNATPSPGNVAALAGTFGKAMTDPSTGRPAWTGPLGQPGSSTPTGTLTTAYTMPDGRVAYYDPNAAPSAGNVQALQYAGVAAPVGPDQQTTATTQQYQNIQNEVGQLAAAINSQNQEAAAAKAQQGQNALLAVEAANPWLGKMGLTKQLQQWVTQGYTDADALTALIRSTPQWEQMFPGIRRPDGTLRYNEGQYLQYDDAFRLAIKNFGPAGTDYSTPQSMAAFHEQGITPDDLTTRLQTYNQIARSSNDVKAAFYVYGGLNVSNEDLYRATVDPAFAQQLSTSYTQALATAPPDYKTFITRATEFSLNSVAAKVAQATGSSQTVTTQQLHLMDPNDARELITQLHQGSGSRYLNLAELQNAFESALIGGAATTAGLKMPDADRVEQFRQAGINQAQAEKGFADIAQNQHLWSGAGQRSGRGGFDQSQLENALFLNSAQQLFRLTQAQQGEQALGQSSGGLNVTQPATPGIVQQTGFLGRY